MGDYYSPTAEELELELAGYVRNKTSAVPIPQNQEFVIMITSQNSLVTVIVITL